MKIEIHGLNQIYPNGNHALKDINLEFGTGMFGLLGPNGAGKSSLMRIMVTLLKPTSGVVLVDGKDIQKCRKELRNILGYLPQDFRFFTSLKTWEFLDYSGSLAGLKNKKERIREVDRLLDQVGLLEVRDRQANRLSGGMKRRLGIAQALIGNPKIIVVDEPTTGLDPDERIRFRNILSQLSQHDVTIIFSTHIIEDISSFCNQVAVLNKGKLRYFGKPIDMTKEAEGHVWQFNIPSKDFGTFIEKHLVVHHMSDGDNVRVRVISEFSPWEGAINASPNLEDAYLWLLRRKDYPGSVNNEKANK